METSAKTAVNVSMAFEQMAALMHDDTKKPVSTPESTE
jgi:hypothetical protein